MREKIISIQFLRFVAAMMVVLYHTTVALDKYFPSSLSHAIATNALLGASGVHIFFVISGFIMVYTSFEAADRHFDAPIFAYRRFSRIYPIYIIYALAYLAFYAAVGAGKNLSGVELIGSLLLFPGYSSFIIGPGWTLSYEVYFYLCFGVSMLLGLTRGLIVLTFYFVAAMAGAFIFNPTDPTIHVLTGSLLVEFLLGAWTGYAVICSVRISNGTANAMLVLAIIGFLAGIVLGFRWLPTALGWGIPAALLVGSLVFREANGAIPSIIRRWSLLGDSSYSLYLLHVMLIDIVVFSILRISQTANLQEVPIGSAGMIGIVLAISVSCIAVAHASYLLIERRLLRVLHSFRKRTVDFFPRKQRVG